LQRKNALQRNDSLQWIETGCETFRVKRFEKYFATVWYLQLETIYSFHGSFEGKRLCNDNFRFTDKTDFVLPRNDNRFHPFAKIMQRFNLEKLLPKGFFLLKTFALNDALKMKMLTLEKLQTFKRYTV
jgi:hypothetical protein